MGRAVIFKVADHRSAYDIVYQRSVLKDSGISILDVLSEREEQQHRALVPRFHEAREKGLKAQFYRHRLKIEGKWV